jgi:DNA-binding NarL/FixJ family response regulator
VVTSVSVLIVEDEQFTRTMLGTAVVALGMRVQALCSNAEEAMAASAHAPEVAILDLDLGPGPSGIDIAYALRARLPNIGLVFLTTFSDPRIKDPGERPLPRGSRYLIKSHINSPEVIREAVAGAARTPLQSPRMRTALGVLTPKQIDVLKLVALGMSNADIAAQRQVTEKAIERMVQRICDALEVDRSAGNSRVAMTRAYAELAGKIIP